MVSTFIKSAIRFRTWIVDLLSVLVTLAPEILNSPEILLPQEWQRYFLAALFLLNIWMRPRPAVLRGNPEAQAKKGGDMISGSSSPPWQGARRRCGGSGRADHTAMLGRMKRCCSSVPTLARASVPRLTAPFKPNG